jgi:UDP-2-acetamido-3-amino-2,3-dideoxy-glucuronate N-acetyltransferase
MVSASAAAHPTAIIESHDIGEGSTIGAYSRVGADVRIGAGCAIGDHVFLDGPVRIADGVRIASHAYLQGPLTIESGARIGPQSCIDGASAIESVCIGEGAVIGAQATLWPGVTVGKGATVKPGSVVSKNVPAMAIVSGNPAKIVRYRGPAPARVETHSEPLAEVVATEVDGVTLHKLPLHEDLRGNLTFGEAQRHVPFAVKRYFLTFDVASEEVRGEHAHLRLHQFLVCVKGRVHIVADNGGKQADFLLERPNVGVHIPPMIWSIQYRFSADAVLLGLCSDYYDPADYIRDYSEFLARCGASDRGSRQNFGNHTRRSHTH